MGKLAFTTGGTSLQTWPETLRAGDRLHIAFLAPALGTPPRDEFEVTVYDHRRRRVATVVRGALRPAGGVVCIEWDGCDHQGSPLPPGHYQLRVTKRASTFLLERTIHLEG